MPLLEDKGFFGTITSHVGAAETTWISPLPVKGHLSAEELIDTMRRDLTRHTGGDSPDRLWPIIHPCPTYKMILYNFSFKKEFPKFLLAMAWGLTTAFYCARYDPSPGIRPRLIRSMVLFHSYFAYIWCFNSSYNRLIGIAENDWELAVYGPEFPDEVMPLKQERDDRALRKMMVFEMAEKGGSYSKAITWENPLVRRHHERYVEQQKEWQQKQDNYKRFISENTTAPTSMEFKSGVKDLILKGFPSTRRDPVTQEERNRLPNDQAPPQGWRNFFHGIMGSEPRRGTYYLHHPSITENGVPLGEAIP